MKRHHSIIGKVGALLLAASANLTTLTDAQAESLQNCDPSLPSNPTATLPIGTALDDGFSYRNELYQFLAGTQLADVAYPAYWYPANSPFSENIPYWQSGMTAFGVYSYTPSTLTLDPNGLPPVNYFGGGCVADWNQYGPTPTQHQEQLIEQNFLHLQLHDIGKDTLKRFMLNPTTYLLANIEDSQNCEALIPNQRNYLHMTFIAQSDYPGNIFQDAPAPTLRRFSVFLALTLIQLDWATWTGASSATLPPYPALNSQPLAGETFLHPGNPGAGNYATPAGIELLAGDNIGERLNMMARIYQWIDAQQPSWLTNNLNDAFLEGIARMAERLARMTLTGIHTNRSYAAVHALAAAKAVLANTPWQNDATDWHNGSIAQLLTTFHEAGYLNDDDGRYDAAYNRYNLPHIVRVLQNDPGTLIANVSALQQQAHALGDLEAHLVFTDRTGRHTSPSAMSVRTGGGVVYNSINVASAPEFAMNYLKANDYNVPFSYARVRDLAHVGPYYHATSGNADARSSNPDFHAELVCINHPNHDPYAWLPQLSLLGPSQQTEPHLSGSFRQYSRPRHYVEGYDTSTSSPLRNFADAVDQNPASAYLPFELPGPYLHSNDDEFVFGKFGGQGAYLEGAPSGNVFDEYQAAGPEDFAVMFHLGPVSSNNSACDGESVPRGYGGGQIAALWAPGGGVFSLTRRKGYNNPDLHPSFNAPPGAGCDSWKNLEWAALPIHAVTLVDTSYRAASSSRIAAPTVATHFASLPGIGGLGQDFLDDGATALSGVSQTTPQLANSAFLEVSGDFSDQRYATGSGVLSTVATPVRYRRRFVVSDTGLLVRTIISNVPVIAPPQRLAGPSQLDLEQVNYFH